MQVVDERLVAGNSSHGGYDANAPDWRKTAVQYAIAPASVALAAVVRLALNPLLHSGFPLFTFVVAVAAAAWYGGLGPAIVAIILGYVTAAFVVPPYHSFAFFGPSSEIGFAAYAFVGLCNALFAEAHRHAQRRAEAGLRAVAERERQLDEANAHISNIIEGMGESFILLDSQWRHVAVNERAAQLGGRTRAEVEGKTIWEIFPESVDTPYYRILHQAITEQRPVSFEWHYAPTDRWLETRAYPSRDGLAVYSTDITERTRAQMAAKRHREEVEELNVRLRQAMRETHHRVKNNLQVIAAMVDMQVMSDRASVSTEELVRLGKHIKMLAAVHDLLTQEARDDADVNFVSAQAAVEKLLPLAQAIAGERCVHSEVDDVRLPVRHGTALAIVMNELISNAVKHGRGDILFRLRVAGANVRLEVHDDGPGFPNDFDPVRAANTGLELIEAVSRWDLQGTTSYESRPDGGGRVCVTFPLPPRPEPASDSGSADSDQPVYSGHVRSS